MANPRNIETHASDYRLIGEPHIAPNRYNSSMTLQTFRDLLSQKPFKPFRLVMSSGDAYEVRHPEMAFLTRDSIVVGLDVPDDGIPAEFKICSLLHVTAIEPLVGSNHG